MAVKTILGQVIIWYDKHKQFDINNITKLNDKDLKYWCEIEEIKPPVEEFSDGGSTKTCKWLKAKVMTETTENQISPPQLFSSRMALSRALDETPEFVSYRWKY
jgi:hypothetical protein